jgi:hypothetical protein
LTDYDDFKEQEMDEGDLFKAIVHRQDNGKLLFYMETAEGIEEFFQTEETGQSNQWKNGEQSYHDYYKRQYERDGNSDMAEYFRDKNDKFGGSYVDAGKINIGLLRTVGISEGVEFEIPESYSEETLKESVETLKNVVEEIYKEFIRPMNVKTVITVEEL